MMNNYLIYIFLIFIFIIILINLKKLLFKKVSVEHFDLSNNFINNLDKKINDDIGNKIQNLINDINDSTPLSLKDNVQTLYDRTKNLYDDINDNKEICQDKYDSDYSNIINNYNSYKDKICLKNISDISDAKYNLSSCSELCNNNKDCLSFSYDKANNDCRLSTICHPNSETTFTQNFSNTLYVKKSKNEDITNYKLNQNQQCNNLCHNDIIGSSTIEDNVHECASKSDKTDNSVSFEYNFNNNECTLREKCKQGTHLEDSNMYNCDKGQITNEKILQTINYDINKDNISNDNKLDYYTLSDLKGKCKKLCAKNIKCKAFSYEFTEDKNNCTLYEDLEIEKNISQDFKNICKKPENLIKKNLYTKKISVANAQKQAQSLNDNNECQALCENSVSDDIPYIKFYKEKEDANYSYITFTDMYNIKELDNFNLMDYKFIGIKMGYKVIFQNNENYVSIDRVFQNPDEYNIQIDKLKHIIVNESENDDDSWRGRINVIKIQKLDNNCRGRMSSCNYDTLTGTYKKKFNLFYGGDDDLQKCFEDGKIANTEIECYNTINGDGYWSSCVPDGSGVYKKQWIETRPPNGLGNSQDKYGNYIYSEGLSGCGSGSNAGYNNKNILINCNPNFNDENDENDENDGPFLINGSYVILGSSSKKYIINSLGEETILGSNNNEIVGETNLGSSTNGSNICMVFN